LLAGLMNTADGDRGRTGDAMQTRTLSRLGGTALLLALPLQILAGFLHPPSYAPIYLTRTATVPPCGHVGPVGCPSADCVALASVPVTLVGLHDAPSVTLVYA
jgi:hypothetical protein